MSKKTLDKSGTFILNKNEAIHRWYPYLEGYSSCLIQNQLDSIPYDIQSVYDPFGGTGTTLIVASQRGLQPYFSESNPFMNMVTNTKINAVHNLVSKGIGSKHLSEFLQSMNDQPYSHDDEIIRELYWGGFEVFFHDRQLSELLHIKNNISMVQDENTRQILMLALSAIIVPVSRMIRRGDLRYAKPEEKDFSSVNVNSCFIQKLSEIIEDIDLVGSSITKQAVQLSYDARNISDENLIDCIITSPPYLNGTNYIRNTKLELKLNDFISTPSDLPAFHSKGIIAGINNVSKRHTHVQVLEIIKHYTDALNEAAYDGRIPLMVAGYFYDMFIVLQKLYRILKKDGIFIMDIGDSQFAGIHIPTHELLNSLCEQIGFQLTDEKIFRERRSKNGMILTQRLLTFKLKNRGDYGKL